MKKNTWCLLLLTITLLYVPLSSQRKQNLWWQSRTDIEKGIIIAACTLATTVVIGVGVKTVFFSNAKRQSEQPEQPAQPIITKPIPDVSHIFDKEKEYEECYLILPSKEGKAFLINKSDGNCQVGVKKQAVNIIPLNIVFSPTFQEISVLEECCPADSPQSIFLKGEAACIEEIQDGNHIHLISNKKLLYAPSNGAKGKNISTEETCFPCIKINGHYIIVPHCMVRAFEAIKKKINP